MSEASRGQSRRRLGPFVTLGGVARKRISAIRRRRRRRREANQRIGRPLCRRRRPPRLLLPIRSHSFDCTGDGSTVFYGPTSGSFVNTMTIKEHHSTDRHVKRDEQLKIKTRVFWRLGSSTSTSQWWPLSLSLWNEIGLGPTLREALIATVPVAH